MSVFQSVPSPAWAMDPPTFDQPEKSRIAFLIRLAALYHNEKANIALLSIDCGFNPATLYMASRRGTISGEAAVAIERVLGREWFPREQFRPDLFTLPQE